MKKLCLLFAVVSIIVVLSGCEKNQIQESPETHPVTVEAKSESTNQSEHVNASDSEILIAYFSRWGNTDYPENVDATTSASIVVDSERFGTTQYVAQLIQNQLGGDLLLIQTKETYPSDFDAVREENNQEQSSNILPELVDLALDISQYDTVFIGYPVWSTDVPQAILSFLETYDLSGETLIPFCTHAGYGAGKSFDTIRQTVPNADVRNGLALDAQEVLSSDDTIREWLRDLNFTVNS